MRLVGTSSGRELAAEAFGDPEGRPVFLLHGTPGSRLGPVPDEAALRDRRVRLITYDRPGYGGSARHPRRRVADAAADVSAVADALGIGRFPTPGRGGVTLRRMIVW